MEVSLCTLIDFYPTGLIKIQLVYILVQKSVFLISSYVHSDLLFFVGVSLITNVSCTSTRELGQGTASSSTETPQRKREKYSIRIVSTHFTKKVKFNIYPRALFKNFVYG